MIKKHLNQNGDTIIEVMLAMTLLTAILFTCWGIINRASQISLAARQRISVVNSMKEQAEIIKSKYPTSLTASIVEKKFTNADTLGTLLINPCDDTRDVTKINGVIPANSFYFNSSATLVKGQLKPVDNYDNTKVWIQLKENTANSYIDFYIRACWPTAGGTQQEDNSQFVVRLNT